MINHEYVSSETPEKVLNFANNCIQREYYHCNKCGMQKLSLLEEIIGGNWPQKVYMNYYFINDNLIDAFSFEDLTCNEVVVKMLVE